MSDTIDLGGNIRLSGFSALDAATMIIVKKIVGNVARELHTKNPFQELHLNLSKQNQQMTVQASMKGKKACDGAATEANLFFAINKALEEIKNQQ